MCTLYRKTQQSIILYDLLTSCSMHMKYQTIGVMKKMYSKKKVTIKASKHKAVQVKPNRV